MAREVLLGGRTYELPTRGLSTSQRALIEELAARSERADTAPYVDVARFGYDTAAIRAAVAAAVADGSRHIRFTRGTYTTSIADALADVTPIKYAVSIPSNFIVDGERGHVIWQTGLGEVEGWEATPAYTVFRVHEPASDVVFRNLNFQGEKPVDEWVVNHRSSAINTGSDIHVETVVTDVLVEGCTFQDLWGFTIHTPGLGERIHALGNHAERCANGQNINSDWSIQAFNTFIESEGIESSSAHSSFIGNSFENSIGGPMSIGGAGTEMPGCVVVGNVVNGGDSHGIIVGGGVQYSVVANNTVRNCIGHGILITADEFGSPVEGLVVSNNVVIDNCALESGVIAGLAIHGGAKHVVTGNVCISTGDGVFTQRCGISVTTDDTVVSGNVCKGGGVNPIDLSIAEYADRVHLGQNQCLTGSEQVFGSIEPDRRSWPSADSIIYQDRLWNGPTGTGQTFDRVYFQRRSNGKMEWGDSSSPVDTNLYRSAANVLKTDDKFVATGGIGVGNTAVATTPGTVTRKMEVFDASGNSLGFVAIYDAIT